MGRTDAATDGTPADARRSKARAAGELVITTGTVIGVVGGGLVGVATPAGAAETHIVTSALDDDGAGLTLREAIALAASGDTITFDPSVTGITLAMGDLDVNKSLIIDGPGSALLTITASGGDRAFYLYAGTDGPVTISGLRVTGGNVEGDGGGIAAVATDLVLDDVTLADNDATGNGGGLSVAGGSLVMQSSRATGNDAGAWGGGVSVGPFFGEGEDFPDGVTITASTLSGNTASSGGGAALLGTGGVSITDSAINGNNAVNEFDGKYLGAGLFLGGNYGAEIVDTTISGNISAGAGGGIAQFDLYGGIRQAGVDAPVQAAAVAAGELRIEGTTISANSAQGDGGPSGGGGVWVGPGFTDVRLVNSTVSGNTAPSSGGGGVYSIFGNGKYTSLEHSTIVGNSAAYGGGVAGPYTYVPGEEVALIVVPGEEADSEVVATHTIIANNTALVAGPDVIGGVEVEWSLVENTADGVIIDQGNNIFNLDPQLGPLAVNGGPTRTHLPNAGSPVVNTGDPNIEGAPATDQRGFARIFGGRIDRGSVEGSGSSGETLPEGPCLNAPRDVFTDVPASNVHQAAVDCLAHLGVTQGGPLGAPDDQYGPALDVTRGQMAGFLARLITRAGGTLPADAPDAFDDDDGTTHEAAINALAAAGVVEGFDDGTYRPGAFVRRDQMASFLLRTHDYISDVTLAAGPNAFDDDEPGNVHEAAINALAAVGVVEGTATPRVYEPGGDVRRDQMASFIVRLAKLLATEGEFPVI